MKRSFLRALLARRAAIKQRWRAALQHAPVRTPLANPELLFYMIDETLDELLGAAIGPKPPIRHHSESDASTILARTSCGCGLNPYIGYFLAGESAIVSVVREIKPSLQLTENDILTSEIGLLFAFRVQSHREVNAFCEICRVEHPASVTGDGSGLPSACPFKALECSFLKN